MHSGTSRCKRVIFALYWRISDATNKWSLSDFDTRSARRSQMLQFYSSIGAASTDKLIDGKEGGRSGWPVMQMAGIK